MIHSHITGQKAHLDSQKERESSSTSLTIDWASSLRRFAASAASTAATAAHVAAPVIKDASCVVARSATDFAQSYQEEAKKSSRVNTSVTTKVGSGSEVPNTLLERSSSVDVGSVNDEEIVFRSPTRSWLESPSRSLFLTHGSNHNNLTSPSPATVGGASLMPSPSPMTSPHRLRLVPTAIALRASDEIPLPTLTPRTSLQQPSTPIPQVSAVIEETEDEGGDCLSEVPAIAAESTRTALEAQKSRNTAEEKGPSSVTIQNFDHVSTSQDRDKGDAGSSSSQMSPISSIDTNGTMDEQVEQVDDNADELNHDTDIEEKGYTTATGIEATAPRIEQDMSFDTVSSCNAPSNATAIGEGGYSNLVLPEDASEAKDIHADASTGNPKTGADNNSLKCGRNQGQKEEAPPLLRAGTKDMETGPEACKSTTEEIAPTEPKDATVTRPNIERMAGSLVMDINPESFDLSKEESAPNGPKEDQVSRPNIERIPVPLNMDTNPEESESTLGGSVPIHSRKDPLSRPNIERIPGSLNLLTSELDTSFKDQGLGLSAPRMASEKGDNEGVSTQSEERRNETDVQIVTDLEPAEDEASSEAADVEDLPNELMTGTESDGSIRKFENPPLSNKATNGAPSDMIISGQDAGKQKECTREDEAMEPTKIAHAGGQQKPENLSQNGGEELEEGGDATSRSLAHAHASSNLESPTDLDDKHNSVEPMESTVDNVERQAVLEQPEERRETTIEENAEGGDVPSQKTGAEKASSQLVGPVEQNPRHRLKSATHSGANFALFDAEADGLYEVTSARTRPSVDSSTVSFRSTDGNQPTGYLDETSARMRPGNGPHHQQSILSRVQQDPKGLVEFLASKLTGYDVQITKRDNLGEASKRGWIDETRASTAYNFDESVFAQQRKTSRPRSLSPPSSPPDIGLNDEGTSDSESSPGSSAESIASFWDMIPEKKVLNVALSSEINHDEVEPEALLTPTSRLHERYAENSMKDPKSQSAPGSIAGSRKFGSSRNRSFVDLTTLASDPAFRPQSRQSRKGGWVSSGKTPSTPLVTIPKNTGQTSGLESASKTDDQNIAETSGSTVGNEKYVCKKAAEPKDTVQVNRADPLPIKPTDSNDKESAGPESITVGWDQEMASQFPNVPDTEDMTEGFEREELLDEALLAFSSLDNIDFLDEVPRHRSTAEKCRVAAIRWKQLVANWKHSETWKAMNTRPCSMHFLEEGQQSDSKDDTESASSSTFLHRWNGNTDLGDGLRMADATSGVRNLSDLSPHLGDGEFLVLSGYLCELGPDEKAVTTENANKKTAEKFLKHSLTVEKSPDGAPSVTDLLKVAESKLADFTNLVRGIADFASHNEPSSMAYSNPASSVSFSVGVKNYSSIRQKASAKYGGDILQVKDILRGQITFPDEGSLVCGLHYLSHQCKLPMNSNSEAHSKQAMTVEIVRVKNLFRVTRMGNSFPSPLPTGYRHILLNLRLDGEMVVGKFAK